MQSLDLNHTSYSDREIEELLLITYPYQKTDVIVKKNVFLDKITIDSSIDIETKRRISNFLDDISNRLLKSIGNSTSDNHSLPSFGKTKNYVSEVDGHFIIKNGQRIKESFSLNSSQGLNVGDDGGAPPGILNPIKYTTIKRALNIDSRFRPNYYNTTSSDQTLTLPYKIDNVINMRLASIELPLTYHTVSKANGNNAFVVKWNSNGLNYDSAMLVTIPDGNYDTNINNTGLTNIEVAINAALQNPDNKILTGTRTISSDASFNLIYTVDPTSGRSIFSGDIANLTTGNADFQIVWAVNADGTPSTGVELPFFLGWLLGYRTNVYNSGPGVGTTQLPASFVSEGICYIKGPSYIFVAIDDYNNNVNNYYISAYNSSINSKNIIARINLSSIRQNTGSYQTGEDDGFSTQINRSRNYFGPVNIEKLRITLYDEYGRVVNLNNMDWSCSLMFECVYSG